ncbi:hypothetical protein POM88_035956 [Heracleum sosnowskyi]|uniref:Partial AB-hydrolase lipase domain-containing protein n=1 Tax=Heracleum sosnowskyi TaxID=360622 RepID=A0AAD8HMF3_9APIA|nr:hypothetical protein POM88_035956 [Heracleum sosnowskyi]
MISMAVHRNLLQLRGFCLTPTERLLVYPHMSNGSGASCLRGTPPQIVIIALILHNKLGFQVTTQDGYILSMQHIPNGRSGGSTGSKPPVLLQHGLLMDAITWLLSPPDQLLISIALG